MKMLMLACAFGMFGAGCSTACPVGAPCERTCSTEEIALCSLDEVCICAPMLTPDELNLEPPTAIGEQAGSKSQDSTCTEAVPGTLRITEVMIDAPTPEAEHEFVEIVNLTDAPVRLSGVQLLALRGQSLKPRVSFSSGCLPSRGAVALYADQTRWRWDPAPESAVGASTTQFAFSNQADFHFELQSSSGITLDQLKGPGSTIPEESSIVRYPDLEGSALAIHHRVAPEGEASSPGVCTEGTRFVDGCPQRGEEARSGSEEPEPESDAEPASQAVDPPICRSPEVQELAINEILIDGESPDDEHEFVEIINRTGTPLNLAGLTIVGNRGALWVDRVVFESGCLPAFAGVAIFKNEVRTSTAVEDLEISTRRFGINNDAPFEFKLVDPQGVVIDQASGPGDLDEEGVSLTWGADGFVDHLHATEGARPSSPGTCADGSPRFEGCR